VSSFSSHILAATHGAGPFLKLRRTAVPELRLRRCHRRPQRHHAFNSLLLGALVSCRTGDPVKVTSFSNFVLVVRSRLSLRCFPVLLSIFPLVSSLGSYTPLVLIHTVYPAQNIKSVASTFLFYLYIYIHIHLTVGSPRVFLVTVYNQSITSSHQQNSTSSSPLRFGHPLLPSQLCFCSMFFFQFSFLTLIGTGCNLFTTECFFSYGVIVNFKMM
jgi:hypothetical protein